MFKCKDGTVLYGNKCLNCEGDSTPSAISGTAKASIELVNESGRKYLEKLVNDVDYLQLLKNQGVIVEVRGDSFFEHASRLAGEDGNAVYYKATNTLYVTQKVYEGLLKNVS